MICFTLAGAAPCARHPPPGSTRPTTPARYASRPAGARIGAAGSTRGAARVAGAGPRRRPASSGAAWRAWTRAATGAPPLPPNYTARADPRAWRAAIARKRTRRRLASIRRTPCSPRPCFRCRLHARRGRRAPRGRARRACARGAPSSCAAPRAQRAGAATSASPPPRARAGGRACGRVRGRACGAGRW
ncbi:hypothetical protein B0H15DRAFT_576163 [Mycena belliarum]|uniref:Uncharacterized protein n=1 Tax=Mycena belliarum TaxID=1033014 RepID=A0AAD6TT37_9AGAR|nr:hypothetical protein B0H15DRAFT_576163 [Mycena belliae]